MDYLTLLCPIVRLLDLHDSERESGGNPAFTREERTGKRNGVYLDIALVIIECLRELDERANQDYLAFHSIVEYVRTVFDTNENDVLFVLNVLRRPTELWYIDRSNGTPLLHSEKRRTALVEKTDYADEYRLSATGRLLLSLASVARDAAYLRGDAFNLLHAIEWRDFGKILTFAGEISAQLRTEILDIRSALEKIGPTERVSRYVDRFSQYQKVIEETIDILQKAERELDDPDALDAFEQWLDTAQVDDLSFDVLRQSVLNVRRTLTIFNRLVSELVSIALKDQRNAAHPVNFLAMATHYVSSPMESNKLDFMLTQWGALELVTPFHSILDGVGAIRIRVPTENEKTVFVNEHIEPVSRLGKLKFLDAYGQAIADALVRGPLMLSDALENGYFSYDGEFVLGDLVGSFVAPDSLPVNRPIEMRVSPDLRVKRLDNDAQFYFSDIEIRLWENPIE